MPHLSNVEAFLVCILILCAILMWKNATNGVKNNDSPFNLNGNPDGDDINLN